jgi:hypothetical protein
MTRESSCPKSKLAADGQVTVRTTHMTVKQNKLLMIAAPP